ncbi:MAG: hypothetical protein QOJ26_603, partial [Thermoplasmata archaeon]|nr:hypothetical protein [Thermoplasmata archaeon]
MAATPDEPQGLPITTAPGPDEPQRAQSPPRTNGPASAPSARSASAPAPRRRTSYGALWKARIELMRLGNCLMAALGTLVGLIVARAGPLPLATWLAAPIAAFMLA